MLRVIILLIVLCYSCRPSAHTEAGWQKVLVNDADGNIEFGDKSKLIDAVRLGYPVRVGWGGNRVEHVANADFLTIFDGEVFAQIPSVVGQEPRVDGDSIKIRFRPENKWTKIAGSNGYANGFMINYMQDSIAGGNIDRYGTTTWYVLYPAHQLPIEARPLWRSSSPNWETYQK